MNHATTKKQLLACLAVLALVAGATMTQALDVTQGVEEALVEEALASEKTVDLRAETGWEPKPLRVSVEDYLRDFQEAQNHGALAPNPLDHNDIRPGQRILVSIPGEGTFICSMSFIFEDPKTGKLYAGTAGHCLLPSGAVATHGEGRNNYDASGVSVAVCNDDCILGGFLSGFFWDALWLGKVEYARQTDGATSGLCSSGGVGNDFGLIEIHPDWYDTHSYVNPAMAVWHGPHGQANAGPTGQPVVHYGNGVTAGTTFATGARAGVALNDGVFCSFQAITHVYGGDSGSAMSFGGTSAGLLLHGEEALGTITHTIGLGVAFGTPAYGTTVFWGLHMADRDAGLDLELVEPPL